MLKLQYNAQVMHQENRDNRVGVVGNTRADNNSYQFGAVYLGLREAVKKGQKCTKSAKKHPFYTLLKKCGFVLDQPPPSVEKIQTFLFCKAS